MKKDRKEMLKFASEHDAKDKDSYLSIWNKIMDIKSQSKDQVISTIDIINFENTSSKEELAVLGLYFSKYLYSNLPFSSFGNEVNWDFGIIKDPSNNILTSEQENKLPKEILEMAKLYNEKKYLDFANLYAKYTGQELSAQEKGYIKAYQDQYANRKVVPQFVLSQSYDDQYYLEVGVYYYTSTPLEDVYSDSLIIENGNFKANNKDEFRK